MKAKWLIGAALVLIALGTLGLGALWASRDAPDSSGYVGEPEAQLPAFRLPDLDGREHSSERWQGKVVLVNFWATWCPPCRREMPHLVDAYRQYREQGFEVVGIAIDEVALVRDFVDIYAIDFPILIGGAEAMQLSGRMGNRFASLPFSVLYNRSGEPVMLRAGELTAAQLDTAIRPLLDL